VYNFKKCTYICTIQCIYIYICIYIIIKSYVLGVYLPEFPREVSVIYLFPGSRADVAVKCSGEGTITIIANPDSRRRRMTQSEEEEEEEEGRRDDGVNSNHPHSHQYMYDHYKPFEWEDDKSAASSSSSSSSYTDSEGNMPSAHESSMQAGRSNIVAAENAQGVIFTINVVASSIVSACVCV
jgi:hypothetical protein